MGKLQVIHLWKGTHGAHKFLFIKHLVSFTIAKKKTNQVLAIYYPRPGTPNYTVGYLIPQVHQQVISTGAQDEKAQPI